MTCVSTVCVCMYVCVSVTAPVSVSACAGVCRCMTAAYAPSASAADEIDPAGDVQRSLRPPGKSSTLPPAPCCPLPLHPRELSISG